MGGWVVGGGVEKCVTKENLKSDLDLDLGFVNIIISFPRGWILSNHNKVQEGDQIH